MNIQFVVSGHLKDTTVARTTVARTFKVVTAEMDCIKTEENKDEEVNTKTLFYNKNETTSVRCPVVSTPTPTLFIIAVSFARFEVREA